MHTTIRTFLDSETRDRITRLPEQAICELARSAEADIAMVIGNEPMLQDALTDCVRGHIRHDLLCLLRIAVITEWLQANDVELEIDGSYSRMLGEFSINLVKLAGVDITTAIDHHDCCLQDDILTAIERGEAA